MPKFKFPEIPLWIVSLSSILIVVTAWYYNYSQLAGDTNRGTFGDMFGATNALFSGLAFAGIIITILLQRKELELQRKELTDTRTVFSLQRFENTFFNLIQQHNQIVAQMSSVRYKNNTSDHGPQPGPFLGMSSAINSINYSGREVFERFFPLLVEFCEKNEPFTVAYELTYPHIRSYFGHYFRNLYRILKFVDETEFIENESEIKINYNGKVTPFKVENYKIRYKYTSILRSQLSDYELAWLFYNSLSQYGNKKLLPLIEKYTILKNFPDDLRIDSITAPVECHNSAFYKIDEIFKSIK